MAYCDNVVERKRNCPYRPEEPDKEECQEFGSTIVVPELEIYARRFIIESEVNKHGVPFPPEITTCTDCWREGSFITMLFDECYDLDYYRHLYYEVEDKLDWPLIVLRRLSVYPVSARYYELNDAGRNLFLLQDDDFTLLDSLLVYRNDSTALVVIDTTNGTDTTFIYDATADVFILSTCLNCLETELSKLIFVYLDLLVNKNISNYSTDEPISTDYSLQTVYELFVLDKYFEYVSCLAVDVRPGARDPDYAGIPYDPSGGAPNPPGGEGTNPACEEEGGGTVQPNPSILKYPPSRKISTY